ncbi:tetratricopeptide repeat protein [bacterium]|nr:tetratricopeptide repeat protein [bacterium]
MKKLFKLIINLIPITLIILAVVGYFFISPWKNWCNRQRDKAIGVYNIYQGDKALEKSMEKDADIAKELTNAVKFYNKGLKRYPEHYQARCNLANIYVIFEDYSDALEQYKSALQYKPDYIECRMNLGLLEADELSRYDDAIENYKEITTTKKRIVVIPLIYNNKRSVKENKINAYYNMGLAYRGKTMFAPKDRLKDNQYLKEAVIAYNKAVEAYEAENRFKLKKKNNYDVLYNLGLTHHLLGNTKQAGLSYCKAIEVAPHNYEAHLNLAILLDGMKEYDAAINEFVKAGMLVNSDDNETVLYLNELLNDTNKKNAIMKEINSQKINTVQQKEQKKGFWKKLFEKKEEEKPKKEEQYIIFKNGKAKIKYESDKEYNKNIKKCEAKKIFKEML